MEEAAARPHGANSAAGVEGEKGVEAGVRHNTAQRNSGGTGDGGRLEIDGEQRRLGLVW